MEKYTQMLGRVVTISTYAIMFCVVGNMVMPALIVESVHAQAVASSTTAQAQAITSPTVVQPQLSASDKKLLDKAQADTKIAMYKDWGLTKTEIAFSEDKSFDMDVINQKVDKYVTYDKNAVASLNANAYRKDGTVKLSKSNTELVISISNKKIAKYNQYLRNATSTKSTEVKSSSVVSTSLTSLSLLNTTKTILSRGYEVTTELSAKTNSANVMSAFSGPCDQYVVWMNYRLEWWGYIAFSVRLTDCATLGYSVFGALVGTLSGAIAFAVPPLAPIAGPVAVTTALLVAVNEVYRYWCRYSGYVVKLKGMYWNLQYSLGYITCN